MPVKYLHAALLALPLVACQGVPSVEPSPKTGQSELVQQSTQERALLVAKGRALAQESCAGCHAIGDAIASPNSNAPLFPVIVNQEGVSSETLSYWLKGAHNYPSEMDFYLDAQKVDALVAYMLTLQDPDYKRPTD